MDDEEMETAGRGESSGGDDDLTWTLNVVLTDSIAPKSADSRSRTCQVPFEMSSPRVAGPMSFAPHRRPIGMDAREYHEVSKHSPEKLRNLQFIPDRETKPRPLKQYQDLEQRPFTRFRPPQIPALSAIAESRAAPTGTAGPLQLDRETLATLCYEASGIIKRATLDDGRKMLFRAASCTGKLYHIDLYPVVGDVQGLEPGVYHFDPRNSALDVLRVGDYRGNLAAAVGEGNTDTPGQTRGHDGSRTGVASAPVSFVATSTWWRNAWKYRERTYRHAFWDAGTIIAHLLATAHAMDHPAATVVGFADDSLVELLGITPEREAPVAMVPVGGGSPVDGPRDVSPIDPAIVPNSSGRTVYPEIHDAWQESTLPDGTAAADWRAALTNTTATAERSPGDGERVPLDPVDVEIESKRPLSSTIRRRRSCREFTDEGPTRRQVGTVLDRALRGVPGDWNTGTADRLAFCDCYILATGVDGLPNGTYQYHPSESVLERLGDATSAKQRHLALNQPWAGDAHLNVYLLADVETITESFGNRGYRLAQLEAGITLGRLYLATYAHRTLGGTGLTFFDDLVTDHLSPRAHGQTPMTLFAFGGSA